MPIGSKILVYATDKAEGERLIRLLMYQRFVPKVVDNVSYANLALLSGEHSIFLCVYDSKDVPAYDFLKFMRQDEQMRNAIPVVLLSNPTQESITQLIKIGCSNFILQSAGEQIFIDKIESIAESIGDSREKRQFVRIELPEYENAQLLITARNGNKYPVRVNNVSMGGIQLVWSPEKIPVQKMSVGDTLMNCLLVAKSLDLYIDLKIISVFDYKAGAQFTGLNEERQSKLCNFIYERLLAEKVG